MLNLEIGYFSETKKPFSQRRQMYPTGPFTVTMDKSHSQPINTNFYIDIRNDKTFRLKVSNNEAALYNYVDNLVVSENNVLKLDTICKFNETIKQ